MATIRSTKEIRTHEDAEGNITQNMIETTTKIERSQEPDFVKLYADVWCEFNKVPVQWRPLFLELVTRMSYANSHNLEDSQIVATGGPVKDAICKSLHWKPNMYQKGLQALREAGAIRQRSRGFYQINPNYAGRGEWKYNPRLDRGGIEDLKATFDFVNGTVKTSIVWADDGTDSSSNQDYRDGLGVSADDRTVIKISDFSTDPAQQI